jgi:hypothetical protein
VAGGVSDSLYQGMPGHPVRRHVTAVSRSSDNGILRSDPGHRFRLTSRRAAIVICGVLSPYHFNHQGEKQCTSNSSLSLSPRF